MSSRRALALAVVATSLASAAGAAAQPSANDAAVAEVLFEEGKRLMADGKLAEACPKLAESNRLDTGIGTLLFLADCYEKNGQVASAWATFREAATLAQKTTDSREKIAQGRAAALEPVLPRLTVAVPAASRVAGLRVERDGAEVGTVQWDVALPMDPGKHALTATAPGRVAWTTTVVVERGVRARVEIPTLAPAPTKPTDPPGAVARSDEGARGGTQRVVGVGLAAAGVVALGAGGYFGLAAKGKADDASGHCSGNACDPTGLELRDGARSRADLATGLFVGGAVAVVAGVVVWWIAPRGSARATRVELLRF